MPYLITTDKDVCISCGACAAISPDTWEMDDEGYSKLKNSKEEDGLMEREVSDEEYEQIKDAVESCPTGAIKAKKL